MHWFVFVLPGVCCLCQQSPIFVLFICLIFLTPIIFRLLMTMLRYHYVPFLRLRAESLGVAEASQLLNCDIFKPWLIV